MHKKLLRLSLLLPLISIFFYYVWAPLIFLQWCFDMCCDWAIKWQIVIRHVGGLLWSHLCCDTVSCWQGCPHMLAVCPWPAGSSRRSTRSPPGLGWSPTPGSPASRLHIQIILNNTQFSGNFFLWKKLSKDFKCPSRWSESFLQIQDICNVVLCYIVDSTGMAPWRPRWSVEIN